MSVVDGCGMMRNEMHGMEWLDAWQRGKVFLYVATNSTLVRRALGRSSKDHHDILSCYFNT